VGCWWSCASLFNFQSGKLDTHCNQPNYPKRIVNKTRQSHYGKIWHHGGKKFGYALPDKTLRTVLETLDGAVFVGTDVDIFKSSNGGQTWKQVFDTVLLSCCLSSQNKVLRPLLRSRRGLVRQTFFYNKPAKPIALNDDFRLTIVAILPGWLGKQSRLIFAFLLIFRFPPQK